MPTNSGFLQFSIAEELSGYKIDVNTAILVIITSILFIKIVALIV